MPNHIQVNIKLLERCQQTAAQPSGSDNFKTVKFKFV